MSSLKSLVALLALPVLGLADDLEGLRSALTHHVSFDRSLNADFSRGDPALRERIMKEGKLVEFPVESEQGVGSFEEVGKHGRSFWFTKKEKGQLFYGSAGILNYSTESWSGSVSVWLRVNPDDDIPAGYSDPIMITADDTKAGFMFLEWSPEVPRRFRYAILPKEALWNSEGTHWEKIPAERRPMVEMSTSPFSRDKWTHVVFTFDRINQGEAANGRLYIDGNYQGEIKGWNQIFGWDSAKLKFVIGRSYVGGMDDLTVFDRAITEDEVRLLHTLANGGATLTSPKSK